MTIVEIIILYWLLPALISLLLLINIDKYSKHDQHINSREDWGVMTLAGIFYPITWIMLIFLEIDERIPKIKENILIIHNKVTPFIIDPLIKKHRILYVPKLKQPISWFKIKIVDESIYQDMINLLQQTK